MVLQSGTKVKVDGIVSEVHMSVAAGKHRQTHLKDGRVIVDLEKSIAAGTAEVLTEVNTSKPEVRRGHGARLRRSHDPVDEED